MFSFNELFSYILKRQTTSSKVRCFVSRTNISSSGVGHMQLPHRIINRRFTRLLPTRNNFFLLLSRCRVIFSGILIKLARYGKRLLEFERHPFVGFQYSPVAFHEVNGWCPDLHHFAVAVECVRLLVYACVNPRNSIRSAGPGIMPV